MAFRRTSLTTRATVATAALGLALTSQGTALASVNPYTPTSVCGSGYRVIDSSPLQPTRVGVSTTGGQLYLLYNASNGYNCVVTIKSVAVGTPTQTTADLQIFEGNRVAEAYRDRKNYKYYAGPVKARAAGRCVAAYGDTDAGNNTFTNNIPKGHCG
ncbi:hypothetical protein AB0B45_49825 [Nonomuraea sp. NPDC049152]|uniref:hypothetical protein n=1 Tax=Nonomuraea sp. NPDC049152 TaxID=3154350 RepID=UPI00340C6223